MIQNRNIIEEIFTALSNGNDEPLLAAMADEMTWNWKGSLNWTKSFKGKDEVVNGLWRSVRENIKKPYKVNVHRIIGETEFFAVEMTGRNTTSTDKRYENNYCWVCHMKNGKLVEINEYMDTELVSLAFGSNK
jgi:ketosteroid isomerase-like protein